MVVACIVLVSSAQLVSIASLILHRLRKPSASSFLVILLAWIRFAFEGLSLRLRFSIVIPSACTELMVLQVGGSTVEKASFWNLVDRSKEANQR